MNEIEEPSFLMRAFRYMLSLMLGALIIIKGVDWIGTGAGVYFRTLVGTLAGGVVVLVSGSRLGWILELILFAVCFLFLGLPLKSEMIGAQLDIAVGLVWGWFLARNFVREVHD